MTTTLMFSSAFVQDLSDAMFEPHGTMVDVFAVVASVGPWIDNSTVHLVLVKFACWTLGQSWNYVYSLCFSPMVDLSVNTYDYFSVMCSDHVTFL
jgi:hypothetical protein